MYRKFCYAAALVALLGVPAQAKDQTFNDDEQRAMLNLCELAKYASHVQADQVCAYFEKKIGVLPPPARPPVAENKPADDKSGADTTAKKD